MKKTITSAGLVIIGAASLQAQNAAQPGLTSLQTTKPWSVSATLRGFYDDNYATRPANASPGVGTKRDSFGFELSPSASLNWVLPQTYVGLSYQYGMKYYEDRVNHSADHTHQADLKLSHAFTELYKLDVSDSFVVAQEPDLIDKGGPITRPLRTEGSNLRNTATANFTAGLTEKLSTVLGYSNTFYDYEQDGIGSLSALLDRTEHLGTVNLRWQAMPTTVGILGYQYGVNAYDSDNVLGMLGIQPISSDIRDNTSHYAYVGADHSFSPQLNGSLRVGAQFTQYDNVDENTVSPYADASATWSYTQGSYIQLGVRHQRQATDVAFFSLNTPTLDQEATTAYGSVNHKLTAKLMGSLMAQFQNSSFNGGGADSQSENLLLAGLNFSYEINKFLSADAGYNFDRLDSDLNDRSFTRNRVYLGIRATY